MIDAVSYPYVSLNNVIQTSPCTITTTTTGTSVSGYISDFKINDDLYSGKSITVTVNDKKEKGKSKTCSWYKFPEIEKVIFNEPATIVFWTDGTKTVVKVKDQEEFDPWTGLSMCVCKKAFGNKFHRIFKDYCDSYYETFDSGEIKDILEGLQKHLEFFKEKK